MRRLLVFLTLLFIITPLYAQKFEIEKAPAPLYRDLQYDGAADPAAVYNKEKNAWHIFYTQRRANIAIQNLGDCYGTAIGIAISETNGKTWYYAGTANLPMPDPGYNTFWAPQINYYDGIYHLFVTYIKGVYSDWDGDCRILHYTSKDLWNWKLEKETGMNGYIDACVFQMPDKTWKMWYKDKKSHISVGVSNDLYNWTDLKKEEVNDVWCEGPLVFRWKDSYWMIVDECNLAFIGLTIYKSDDLTNWVKNGDILSTPGKRKDDNDQGRHCDVIVDGDRAYVVYFTHPGRSYDSKNVEIYQEESYQYRRCSLQIAEMELVNGKVICDRDKYAALKK